MLGLNVQECYKSVMLHMCHVAYVSCCKCVKLQVCHAACMSCCMCVMCVI